MPEREDDERASYQGPPVDTGWIGREGEWRFGGERAGVLAKCEFMSFTEQPGEIP